MHALNKGLSHAVEGAVESHETGVEIGHQPVYTQQVSANAHAGAEILMHHQESSYAKPPMGRFRSHMCDCLHCPNCLLAWCFPWIIWAQAHKVLHGGVVDQKKGMRGYYAIMGSFIFMLFIISIAGANRSTPFFTAVATLYNAVGFFILVSLMRRARKIYGIRGNHCQTTCCGCCSDGCYDVLKAYFCSCCATFQLGDHLFDYTTNTEITYEASPVVEMV